jgi:hypothetical protein
LPFEIDEGGVRLVKAESASRQATPGQKLVEQLRGGTFKMTTDEVVALMRGPKADEG